MSKFLSIDVQRLKKEIPNIWWIYGCWKFNFYCLFFSILFVCLQVKCVLVWLIKWNDIIELILVMEWFLIFIVITIKQG